MKAKSVLKYPIPASKGYDIGAIKVGMNRLKAGTIGVLESITTSVLATREYESDGFIVESDEFEFYSSFSHLKDIPRDGLVGEWLFYEGTGDAVHDTSGQGNHGTRYGMTWKQLPNGKWVGSFDGIDDYVEVPNSPELKLQTFTIEAIAYPIDYVNSPYQNIVITKGSGGTLNYRFCYLGDGWEFRSNIGGEVRILHVSKPLRKWYQLFGVYDGSSMLFYINGVLEATLDVTGTVATSDEPVRMGWGIVPTAPEYFYGYIGAIRIYNRALTEDEIKDIYEIEKPIFVG